MNYTNDSFFILLIIRTYLTCCLRNSCNLRSFILFWHILLYCCNVLFDCAMEFFFQDVHVDRFRYIAVNPFSRTFSLSEEKEYAVTAMMGIVFENFRISLAAS